MGISAPDRHTVPPCGGRGPSWVGRRLGVVRPLRGSPGGDVVGTHRIASRARALPCTEAHARQEGSGAAAARRSQQLKSRRHRHSSTIATALAGAFLAGDWDPAAMGRRGKRALGDRRKWPTDLAHIVRAAYPDHPIDRPASSPSSSRPARCSRQPLRTGTARCGCACGWRSRPRWWRRAGRSTS